MRTLVFLLAGLLAVVGCTGTEQPPESAPERPSSPPSQAAPSPAETRTPVPGSVHPVSLPALMNKRYDGRRLRLGDVLVRTDAYTQRFVTYRSGPLRISGIMNVPEGKGPFPVLVLAHGYIDPDTYDNGQGLRREQDWLARRGYVVLHTDYRNHAASDDDPRADRRLRLGYTEDVINAVLAVKRSRLRFLDKERVGLLGRSMGGGVAYNVLVTEPGLVDAVVVYAPVSSDAGDNFNRWIRDDPGRSQLSDRIIRRYGTPERNPKFWAAASPRTYFEKITEPLLIHHGTSDESCPIRWSRRSQALLERAGVDSDLVVYPGEAHAFIDTWPASMRRTVRFFDRHLDVA